MANGLYPSFVSESWPTGPTFYASGIVALTRPGPTICGSGVAARPTICGSGIVGLDQAGPTICGSGIVGLDQAGPAPCGYGIVARGHALVSIPEPQIVGPAALEPQFQSHKSLGQPRPGHNSRATNHWPGSPIATNNMATLWLRLATVGN